jgi:glutaredoxin
MYYLKLISLEGCPYSNAANDFVKNNKIESEITSISHSEKDKYKSDKIKTFPQIYLNKKNSSGSVLIGGYDNLISYYESIQSNKKSFDYVIKKIKKDNKNLSEKSILRLIQLLI